MCTNTPVTRVLCEEGATSSDDIEIVLEGIEIDYSGDQREHAVQAKHGGTGNIVIGITSDPDSSDGESTITTSGTNGLIDAIRGHHTGDGKISISVEDTKITTENSISDGVEGYHQGEDDIDINIRNSEIATNEEASNGIYGWHHGEGNITISVMGKTKEDSKITTKDSSSIGIYGLNQGNGRITLKVSDSTIKTEGDYSPAISADQGGSETDEGTAAHVSIEASGNTITTNRLLSHGIRGFNGSRGNIIITTNNNEIMTGGRRAHGIYGLHGGIGSVNIETNGGTITTSGENSNGIYGFLNGDNEGDLAIMTNGGSITTENNDAYGIHGYHLGNGSVKIDTNGGTIRTSGENSNGIYGLHGGTGSVNIETNGGTITTSGENALGIYGRIFSGDNEDDLDITTNGGTITTKETRAYGIYGLHQGTGSVNIETNGGTITTSGENAYGLYGRIFNGDNDGDLKITTKDGHTITIDGNNAHGIILLNNGKGSSYAEVANINAKGDGAHGIRFGSVSNDLITNVTPVDNDGYRRQKVTVNGEIQSEDVGVFLAGGGRVEIGPTGSINSNSRSAILATGNTPGKNPGDPIIKPKLHLSINFDGRRVAEIIGDDGWIINDGGGTTIVVNGVTLHDSDEGVTDKVAPDGARDYWIRPEGVMVTDRTADTWDISDPAVDVIDDRDFSAADFIWEYAPRAASYEVLPNFLFHLNNQETRVNRIRSSDSPYWISLSRQFWAYQPTHSTVGGKYESSQNIIEAGIDFRLGENLVSSASISRMDGTADVSRTSGGGKILADGFGLALDLSLDRTNGWYARSGLSFTDYDLAFQSDKRGGIASGIEAKNWSFDFEAGRNIKLSSKLDIVPRFRAKKTSISVDEFTDIVGAHVSVPKTSRRALSIGIVAKRKQTTPRMGGELGLQASLDLENSNDGEGTLVQVSGEDLVTKARSNRFILGLGGNWRKDNLFINGEIRATAPSSTKARYSGQITLGTKF